MLSIEAKEPVIEFAPCNYVLEYSAQHPLAFGLYPYQYLYQPVLGAGQLLGIAPKVFHQGLIDFPRSILIEHAVSKAKEIVTDEKSIKNKIIENSTIYQMHLQNYMAKVGRESLEARDILKFQELLPALELRRIVKESLGVTELSEVELNNIINLSAQEYSPSHCLLTLYQSLLLHFGFGINQPIGLFEHGKKLKVSVTRHPSESFYLLRHEQYIGYGRIFIPAEDRNISYETEPEVVKLLLAIKIVVELPLVAGLTPKLEELKFESYHPEVLSKLVLLHQEIMAARVIKSHQQAIIGNRLTISALPRYCIELEDTSNILTLFNSTEFFNNTVTLAKASLLQKVRTSFFEQVCSVNKIVEGSSIMSQLEAEQKIKELLSAPALTDVQIANIVRCGSHIQSNPIIYLCNALRRWLVTHNILLDASTVYAPVAIKPIEIALLPLQKDACLEQKFHVKFLKINQGGIYKSAEELGGKRGGTVLEVFIYCHLPLYPMGKVILQKFYLATECVELKSIVEQFTASHFVNYLTSH